MTDSKPYLGRCRECDYALFATREQIDGAKGWHQVEAGGVPRQVASYGIYARCPKGHKVFRLHQIKGTYSESHTCDSRCLNAKGHDCTCSCGGMNHGRGYAVSVTKLDAQPVETTVVARASEVVATVKQVDYIKVLLDKREMAPEARQEARTRLENGLTKDLASRWIERLKSLPERTNGFAESVVSQRADAPADLDYSLREGS